MERNVKYLVLMLFVVTILFIFMSCSTNKQKTEFKVLLRMMPAQYEYYTQQVIPEFEKKYNCKVTVVQFEKMWDIEKILKLEQQKDSANMIGVVKVPFEMTRDLAKKGYLESFDNIVGKDTLEQDEAIYYPFALSLGYVDGKLYYFPRKLETRILVYLKSKVEDAVKNWQKFKPQIDSILKIENGYGLPKGYTLESDPNKWDYYDVFVVGYYWANTEYNGVKMPRYAHRAKNYEGTALGLIERAYRLNATQDSIVKLLTKPVVDMYKWEALYVKYIYNPLMWQEGWSGSGIWNAFKDGKVFMAEMQQIDCFFLHGWPNSPEMMGYVKNPDDLGFALVPKGVSLELDKDGNPVYTGTKSITTGGWWWGIPKTAKYKKLSYEFIKFVTSKKIQAQEVAKYGILPVRKDLVFKLPEVFDYGWVGEMFKVSSEQVKTNGTTVVPLIADYPTLAKYYIDIWYKAVVNVYSKDKSKKINEAEIVNFIKKNYEEKIAKLKK